MQCHLRSAPNFSPARQHAVNPLASRVSRGARAASSLTPSPQHYPMPIHGVVAPRSHRGSLREHSLLGSREDAQTRGEGETPLNTHPRADLARRGCPCRRRGALGAVAASAGLCGANPAAGPRSDQRARTARPGVRGSPTREGREPPRASQSRFRARCLDAVAVAARAGGFPRAPAPSPPAPLLPPRSHTQNSLSAAPRVPTQFAAGSRRAGTCLQEPQSRCRARRLGGRGRCREGCLNESPALPGRNVIRHFPGNPSIPHVASLVPTKIVNCFSHLKLGRS